MLLPLERWAHLLMTKLMLYNGQVTFEWLRRLSVRVRRTRPVQSLDGLFRGLTAAGIAIKGVRPPRDEHSNSNWKPFEKSRAVF
jgi:hypothetical protein